jgi:hypothetical protein
MTLNRQILLRKSKSEMEKMQKRRVMSLISQKSDVAAIFKNKYCHGKK